MPQILGSFETSLRGGGSPSLERKNKLHKGCCGSLHGHGVKKEKSIRDIVYTGTPASRSCSLAYSVNESMFGANFENSSSEGEERSFANPRGSISPMMSNIPHLKISPTNSSSHKYQPGRGSITPDLLLGSAYRSTHPSNHSQRSQSTDFTNTNAATNMMKIKGNSFAKRSASCTGNEDIPDSSNPTPVNKAIAHRLYNSLTKASAGKRRAERSASDGKRIARVLASQEPRPSSSMERTSIYKSKSVPRSDFNEDSGNFSSCNSDSDEKFDAGTTVQELVVASVTPTQEERRQSLIHGISDDDITPAEELRRKKRLERRQQQHQQHLSGKFTGTSSSNLSSNGNATHRRQSPSPRPKVRINRSNNIERGRRGSEEDDSGSTSGSDISPPSSPSPTQLNTRSASLRPWSKTNLTTTTVNLTARRTKSSNVGNANSNCPSHKSPVGFGSSTSRFNDTKISTDTNGVSQIYSGRENDFGMKNRPHLADGGTGIKNYFTPTKSQHFLAKTNSSDGYQTLPGYQKNYGYSLSRTSSNESSNNSQSHMKGIGRNNIPNGRFKSNTLNRSNGNVNQNSVAHGKCSMQEVAEAWLRFKDDIDNAMELKKPNSGFYKNLSDMMHTKMKMLDQVQFLLFKTL